MHAFTSFVALALALAHTALAGVYITNPVATTNATGGQVLNVQWADDGNTPTVASVGQCSIDLYTGSVNNQVFLQNLAASVDVSKTAQISSTIDPSIGQSGGYYFVRFTSLALKDTKNTQYPYEAFSAKFNLGSMTGTFNSTVLASIDASASASASGSAAAAASGTAKSATTGTKSAATAAATTAKTGAASAQIAPAATAMLLALVGVSSLLAL